MYIGIPGGFYSANNRDGAAGDAHEAGQVLLFDTQNKDESGKGARAHALPGLHALAALERACVALVGGARVIAATGNGGSKGCNGNSGKGRELELRDA